MGNVLNILITGGAGFIGSHLVEKFLSAGEKVIVVDNLLTGAIENLSSFNGNPNFIFMNHDVQHHIDIEMELDYVLHLASAASPKAYTEYPINTLKAGSSGTINTLGLAKAKNAKYLLTSTSEIYGNPKVSPQSETYWGNVNPNGPRSMYDEAKRFSEAAVSSYNRIYNLNTRIVRLFNTYGPKMKIDDGRVVTNFIFQALNGKDITINSGRFGPYLKCENKSARLENVEDLFSIGLNRAITLIAEAKPGRISSSLIKDLGEHPEDKKPVRIMKGQYGPYIKYKSLNATIPEEKDPNELTMEEALILIEKRREYDKAKKKGKRK